MKKNRIFFCLSLLLLSSIGLLKAQNQISGDGINLYGVIPVSWIDGVGTPGPNGLVRFKDDNGIKRTGLMDMAGQSATYYNGKLYVNDYYSDGIDWSKVKTKWRIYNAYTWELESEKELPANYSAFTTSMCYDPTTDKIYALANFSYMEMGLIEIIPETGETRRIGVLESVFKYTSIACDAGGNLYGVFVNDNSAGEDKQILQRINKTDAKVKTVGTIAARNPELIEKIPGLREDGCMLNYRKQQGLVFNHLTGKLYWLCQSYDGKYPVVNFYSALLEINPATAEITAFENLGQFGHTFAGVFFRDAKPEAPAIVSDFAFIPNENGDLTGKFRITTPDSTYNKKKALTGKLSVSFYEGKKLLAKLDNLDPGKEYETEVLTFETPNHVINAIVSDGSNQGVCLERSIVAGFDIPASATNAVLTKDGLTTTVSWTAPTKGFYGGKINPADLNYRVYRYPGEIIVSRAQKETFFTEEHPEEMTRYVYRIVAYAGERNGGWVLSNNLIVGTPLETPYYGFTDEVGMYNYYTIIDNNQDKWTWMYDPTYNAAWALPNDTDSDDADDWMISPAFNLEVGTYRLAFEAYSYNNVLVGSMGVYWGTAPTISGMTQKVLDIPAVPFEATPYEVEVEVSKAGLHHFGFYHNATRDKRGLYINGNIEFSQVINLNVSNTLGDAVKVYSGKGSIEISNPDQQEVKIIGIDGNQVYASSEGTINVNLRSGVYLVTCNGKVQKVSVK